MSDTAMVPGKSDADPPAHRPLIDEGPTAPAPHRCAVGQPGPVLGLVAISAASETRSGRFKLRDDSSRGSRWVGSLTVDKYLVIVA
jgi:hypothetical protein